MDPFVGEIRLFSGNFAPRNWAFCQGQLMAISQNTALFSLLGTQYGGDGRTTFALPNLVGSAAINQGMGPGLSNYTMGQTGGTTSVTLLTSQIPAHTHQLVANNQNATTASPSGLLFGKAASRALLLYGPAANSTSMAANSLAMNGGGQPHANQQPYLVLSYIIALQGVFPQRP